MVLVVSMLNGYYAMVDWPKAKSSWVLAWVFINFCTLPSVDKFCECKVCN